MTEPKTNRQWRLMQRPKGALSMADFAWGEGPVPAAGPGEVLVRHDLLSIDAANRAWMSPVPTYLPPVELEGVMRGFGIGTVLESNDPGLKPGDRVEGLLGWQDLAAVPGRELRRLSGEIGADEQLNLLGITGKTAWFGLFEIGRPRPGETVVISAAAGAVGSVVGQLARVAGARVVGIAGSDEKCRWLTGELGFDAAVNHRDPAMRKALQAACPKGIDIYFDNVGGEILETVLFQLRSGGRIVCCGSVSTYDTGTPPPGPRGIPGLLVVKRLRLEGFIVTDYESRYGEAEKALAALAAAGRVRAADDMRAGLEHAPQALIDLLAGQNRGKVMVRIAGA
ncbi:MAG: NADP-dependent oxidoreductase [Sneathiellaceae bacterium]